MHKKKSHNINRMSIQATRDILQLLHMEIPIKAILPLAWEPPKIDASQLIYPHLVSSTPILLTDRFFMFKSVNEKYELLQTKRSGSNRNTHRRNWNLGTSSNKDISSVGFCYSNVSYRWELFHMLIIASLLSNVNICIDDSSSIHNSLGP